MSRYYPLTLPSPAVLVNGPAGSWEQKAVHTLSVAELNKDGYRFWGYYTGYNGVNQDWDIGLAWSNDLEHWVKYQGNPIIRKLRWASVAVVDGVIHMFGTRKYNGSQGGSYIVRLSSRDSLRFIEQETVVPRVEGENNQNPFIFHDENRGLYRLYWFNGDARAPGHRDLIKEKHSGEISNLAMSQANTVLSSSSGILAAPSVMHRDGKYWLTAETLKSRVWMTVGFVSDHPVRGFLPLENHRLFTDNDACYFQQIIDNQLNGFYSHLLKKQKVWHMRRVCHGFAAKTKIDLLNVPAEIRVGQTGRVNVVVTRPGKEREKVTAAATWATSDNNILLVEKGLLTGVSEGVAVVTAAYGGASKNMHVRVTS